MKYRKRETLLDADIVLRKMFPSWPSNTPSSQKVVLATIEVIGAFEGFGHHEDWGQGYRVSSQGITVESEFLDTALEQWSAKAKVKP